MSDRPQGSVRTGSRGGDTPSGGGTPAEDGKGKTPGQGGATGQQSPGQPAPGTGSAPTTGTQSIPTTGTQSIPTTGTQSIPTTGTQSIPTGSQAAAQAPGKSAGKRANPATGTQSIPVTGSQRAAGGNPAAAPPVGVPPVPVPPSAGAAPSGGSAQSGAPKAAASAQSASPQATSAQAASGQTGAPKGRQGRGSGRGPRRARLQLRHIDTWSALKISLVLSIALFFIWMVAVGVLYLVLNSLGVFDTLNELFGQLGTESDAGVASEVLTPGVVFGGAAVIGAINIVLLTALCTVGTFIYNMCSDLVGGLEVTLSERD